MSADETRTAAIEAGAKAIYTRLRTGLFADTDWADLGEGWKSAWRAGAADAFEAMAPIILVGTAERPETSQEAHPHCETAAPVSSPSDRLRAPGGAVAAEGAPAESGESPPLTDLIGLDPNFTGGMSVDDHLRDQYCDGPHLDEAAIRQKMRSAIADQIEDDCDHNPKRACDACDHAARLVRRIAVTR